MTDEDLEQIAYCMETAYAGSMGKTRGEVVAEVAALFPDASSDLLRGMWQAIDAYVDMNT